MSAYQHFININDRQSIYCERAGISTEIGDFVLYRITESPSSFAHIISIVDGGTRIIISPYHFIYDLPQKTRNNILIINPVKTEFVCKMKR